jgi:hypothetical protein
MDDVMEVPSGGIKPRLLVLSALSGQELLHELVVRHKARREGKAVENSEWDVSFTELWQERVRRFYQDRQNFR